MLQQTHSGALGSMENPLEQQSGLVLRGKQDGERHVFKAPAPGGSLLGAPLWLATLRLCCAA